tara:strand:- start:501 stop:908 length:408 start_codon:yes stop_codon:yes gene_type:complete
MANDIFFGSSEMDDIKFGSSQVDKVYLGSDLVWSPGTTPGKILTSSLDDSGVAAGNYAGTYVVPQDSATASGSGAKFLITVIYVSNKGRSFMTAQQINTGDEGSGYAVGEIITLDMSSVGGTWSPPDIEVLTVTS